MIARTPGANDTASVGILMLETRFPRIPGDVGHGASWPFPVMYKVVRGASPDLAINRQGEGLLDPFIDAARELIAQGAEGITTSCGFLILFQDELAQALDVPVATSSLLQLPLIERLLPKEQRAGILTIAPHALSADHLQKAGCPPDTPIAGLPPHSSFASAILNDEPAFDFSQARQDHINAAIALQRAHNELGAIILECTNMPPYAADFQRATGLPVYSIHNFITWFQSGLRPPAYPAL